MLVPVAGAHRQGEQGTVFIVVVALIMLMWAQQPDPGQGARECRLGKPYEVRVETMVSVQPLAQIRVGHFGPCDFKCAPVAEGVAKSRDRHKVKRARR